MREEETRHLRRDTHDGPGPTLAALLLRVENATARLPSGDPVRDALRAASNEVGEMVTSDLLLGALFMAVGRLESSGGEMADYSENCRVLSA
ncbi:hypothetical protein [Streptomyces sp. NPDC001340]